MAQEQPTRQRQRDPQDVGMQSPSFHFPTPNMPSCNVADASAFETSPFPSFLRPNAQALPVQTLSSNYAPFHKLPFPFPNQFMSLPSKDEATAADASIGHVQGDPTVISEPITEHGHRDSKHKLPPSLNPGSPVQSIPKRSRLPSNDVARKVPRKSTATSPVNNAPRSLNNKPAKAQGRPSKQINHPRRDSTHQGQRKPCSNNAPARLRNPAGSTFKKTNKTQTRAYQSIPPAPARSRPVVLDDDNEDEDEDDENVDMSWPTASIKKGTSRTLCSEPTPMLDIHITQGLPQERPRVQRPRPQYDYPVPKELESLQSALGKDNWNEYLVLMERKWLGAISEEQCKAATKRIFSVFDEPARRRVEKQMDTKVVRPVMEERVRDERERQERHG